MLPTFVFMCWRCRPLSSIVVAAVELIFGSLNGRFAFQFGEDFLLEDVDDDFVAFEMNFCPKIFLSLTYRLCHARRR